MNGKVVVQETILQQVLADFLFIYITRTILVGDLVGEMKK